MTKKTRYIAVDPTANMNPYLTIGPTGDLEWGPRRESAHTFGSESEALETGKAIMRSLGVPGADQRVHVEPF